MLKSEKEIIWFNDLSATFLRDGEKGYLQDGESIVDKINTMGTELEKVLGEEGYAEKFVHNLARRGWYAPSTPFWVALGTENQLPFSCFNIIIPDSMGEISYAKGEVAMQTKIGGGTSGKVRIRGRGEKVKNSNIPTAGSKHFALGFQQQILEVNQGVRRGFMALYWDILHKDIMEVLDIGRDGDDIQDLNYGVCIDENFWQLVDNKDKRARDIYSKTIESRFETGQPYIFFSDNVRKARPDVYVDRGLEIESSNLCTEIMEHSDAENYSFCCDLAAMNLAKYDEWKDDAEAVEILVKALDALHTIYQQRLEKWRDSNNREDKMKFFYLEKTYNSSRDFRDIGLGVIGYHSYLQSKMIPFESMEARAENIAIFKNLEDKVSRASEKLAVIYGEPNALKGYGRRNCLKMAIAPTTAAAFIVYQESNGSETLFSNYYIKKLAQGNHLIKNKYLIPILEERGQNNYHIWKSIAQNDGSVQHLDFLTDHEKAVFRITAEIDPHEVITQAAQRQKYIDQGQSINLVIRTDFTYKEMNKLIRYAHKSGIKSLYYQHGMNEAQQLRKQMIEDKGCISCAS